MASLYSAGVWRDHSDSRNNRWAVLGPTGCWTFPARYGERAARRLAVSLNRQAQEDHHGRAN